MRAALFPPFRHLGPQFTLMNIHPFLFVDLGV